MLDPNRFVAERRKYWKELEREINSAANGSFSSFSLQRARRFGKLYRMASADLIRARTETANESMTDYLNGLVGRAYGVIYRGRRIRWSTFLSFLAFGFPDVFRRNARLILISCLVFSAGLLFGFGAEYYDSSAKHSLVPSHMANMEEHIQDYKNSARANAAPNQTPMALMSAQVTTNNIQVCYYTLALGITAGIGTTAILFYNGVLIGVLLAVMMRHGLGLFFTSLIMAHGVIEVTAICVAGAASYVIAGALVNPGVFGRRHAIKTKGLEAIKLIVGCSVLLVFAGLLEGFVTPIAGLGPVLKIMIGFVTGLILVAYLYFNEEVFGAFGYAPNRDSQGWFFDA